MVGIIFGTSASPPVRGRISRRSLVALTSGAAAGVVRRPSLAHQDDRKPLGTPATGEPAGPERLNALLSLMPGDLLGFSADGDCVAYYYADLALQLASVGIAQDVSVPDGLPAHFQEAISPLATASPAFQTAMIDEFTTAIGFQPLEVGQTLMAGSPPRQVTLFQGGIDLERVTRAWEASGYTRKPTDDGVDIWTIGEDGEFDLDSPIGAYVLGSFNNVTVLDNGVVAFAQTYDLIASAIETANANSPSMLDDAGINAAVAAMPADTVSGIAVTPEFMVTPPPLAKSAATPVVSDQQDGAAEMPPYRSFALGITAGFMNPEFQPTGEGTPDASPVSGSPLAIPDGGVVFARLAADSEDDAATIAEVVRTRWNEMRSLVSDRPYTEIMTIEDARSVGMVAAVDFVPLVRPSVWLDLLLQRDLGPFLR